LRRGSAASVDPSDEDADGLLAGVPRLLGVTSLSVDLALAIGSSIPSARQSKDHKRTRPAQGRVSPEHLDAYLNEFTFRFNRRRSRRRGLLFYRLLEQAIATDPITYRSLVVNPRPTGRGPALPSSPGPVAPLPAVHRPWRRNPADTSAT